MTEQRCVDFEEVECLRETEKALLVLLEDGAEKWLPKSAVHDDSNSVTKGRCESCSGSWKKMIGRTNRGTNGVAVFQSATFAVVGCSIARHCQVRQSGGTGHE